MSHFRTVDTRTVIRSNGHTEDPQKLEANAQNRIARPNCRTWTKYY